MGLQCWVHDQEHVRKLVLLNQIKDTNLLKNPIVQMTSVSSVCFDVSSVLMIDVLDMVFSGIFTARAQFVHIRQAEETESKGENTIKVFTVSRMAPLLINPKQLKTTITN